MHCKVTGIRNSSRAEETCVIISLRQLIEGFHSFMIGTQLDAVWACINVTDDKNSRCTRKIMEYALLSELKKLVSLSHQGR